MSNPERELDVPALPPNRFLGVVDEHYTQRVPYEDQPCNRVGAPPRPTSQKDALDVSRAQDEDTVEDRAVHKTEPYPRGVDTGAYGPGIERRDKY